MTSTQKQPEPAELRRQALLPIAVSEWVALVSIDTARGVLGIDAESISALVDNGELLWVWNFALSPRASSRRELRFWRLDVITAQGRLANKNATPVTNVRGLTLPTVIDTILPRTKASFHAAELQQLFTISAQALHRFVDGRHLEGEVRDHTLWITRGSLAAFLEQRLCHK